MEFGRDVLPGCMLSSNSPYLNNGLAISNNGGLDFWGNVVPNGATFIGASEAATDVSGLIRWSSSAQVYQGDATDESFVSTRGTLIEAINGGGIETTINGVVFEDATDSGGVADRTSTGGTFTINNSNINGTAFTGGEYGNSSAVGEMLKSGFWGVYSVTLNNLIAGNTYEIQLFNNDARDRADTNYQAGYGDGSGSLSGADFTDTVWTYTGVGNASSFIIGPGSTSIADSALAADFSGADFSGVDNIANIITNLGLFDGGTAIGAFYDANTVLPEGVTTAQLDTAGWQFVTAAAVPEPTSLVLLSAFGGSFLLRRRR